MTPPNPPAEQELLAKGAPITQAEIVELFGSEMPIEAVNLLWDAPGNWTVGQIRDELRRIAARTPTPSLIEEGARELLATITDNPMVATQLREGRTDGSISIATAIRAIISACRSPDLAKAVEALNRCGEYFRNSHTSDSYGARELHEMTELCEAALAALKAQAGKGGE